MFILVRNHQTYDRLLRVCDICGKSVMASPRRAVAQSLAQSETGGNQPPVSGDYARAITQGFNLGVVYAVPREYTPDQIMAMTSAVDSRRLSPLAENEEVYSVLLTFQGSLPQYVQLTSYIRLKIYPYALRPMQCKRCWAYGHTQARCLRQTVCNYCSRKGHDRSSCMVLDQPQQARCENCRGAHPATSKICGVYQENLNILRLATSRNPPLTFKEARDVYRSETRVNLSVDAASINRSAALPSVAPQPQSVPCVTDVNEDPSHKIVLAYKELEALAFSHKVILTLLDVIACAE